MAKVADAVRSFWCDAPALPRLYGGLSERQRGALTRELDAFGHDVHDEEGPPPPESVTFLANVECFRFRMQFVQPFRWTIVVPAGDCKIHLRFVRTHVRLAMGVMCDGTYSIAFHDDYAPREGICALVRQFGLKKRGAEAVRAIVVGVGQWSRLPDDMTSDLITWCA
jgi:hypothetical protein